MTDRARTLWAALFTASAVLTTLEYVADHGVTRVLALGPEPWLLYVLGWAG